MLDYLAQAERSVDELSGLVGLSIANTSRHLQILKQNGLVNVRKEGKSRLYKLAGDDVIRLLASLRNTAETHLAEVDRLLSNITTKAHAGQTISSKDLASNFSRNDIIIVDVRPEKEFLEGHILGAINIPPEDIDEKSTLLPSNKKVVTYCRGPYCLYSFELMESLKLQGIEALRLEEGFPEWKAAGLPFE